jgi:phenylpropionate dioxygenase-like ring-hydroxylating dioxygenase large terminal subunit
MGDGNGARPARIPTDDEVERALRRAWFPVARSQDLDRPREAVLLGERLVVYRTASGEAVVADGTCPHRGAALALGHVEGDTVVCPYHGWAWDGRTGDCRNVPSLPADSPIPVRARLRTHRSREHLGLVWCALEEPVTGLPAPPELESLVWTYAVGDPLPTATGMRSATENFRDVAHFPFVHRATMGEVAHVVDPLDVRREGHEVFLERPYSAHGGSAGEIWHEEMTWRYHAIAPNFVCLVMDSGAEGKRILLDIVSPVGPEECVIYWVEGITEDFTRLSLDACMVSEARVFAEDTPILESLRPREAPLDTSRQVHTLADRYILEYRRAFIAFVEAAGAAAPLVDQPVPQTP